MNEINFNMLDCKFLAQKTLSKYFITEPEVQVSHDSKDWLCAPASVF